VSTPKSPSFHAPPAPRATTMSTIVDIHL
jgi:hypothetical protein